MRKRSLLENVVTEGMRQLLAEAFIRLEGKNQNTSGAYLPSQSTGGKTHNLIALGLLARNPSLRKPVMAGFYEAGPLGSLRVDAFSGRKNTQYGIWGELAPAYVFLASQDSSFIADEIIGVSGGSPL